jgi:hypothetical protein
MITRIKKIYFEDTFGFLHEPIPKIEKAGFYTHQKLTYQSKFCIWCRMSPTTPPPTTYEQLPNTCTLLGIAQLSFPQ